MPKMFTIGKPKVNPGAACHYCRNSQTVRAGKGWAIVCESGYPGPASECPEFSDARKPSNIPYTPVGET